ncbi:MAG: glutamine--fructose-6-phosphate transaminase (isomerizing) [Candidatus Levybacteria bacterium]|nr:glutamine--fructose-6-phosphate transaminase (isomerizing) [Candidatus Levybacteria bacterium]
MCGIFGFVTSSQKTASTVLEGLKILEYRGYDSWGIAIKKQSSINIDKHVGKIGNAKTSLPDTTLAIGHTRWATHGGVTTANSHPHLNCTKKLAIVHNGIFENFEKIKQKLLKKGHKFTSQTDTEVIVHLIEEELKTKSFSIAVIDAFNQMHGLNAIVVMNVITHEIIAAKNGSPLIIGITDDGFIIASDLSPILSTTQKVIILKDNELAVLGKKLNLFSLPSGKKITPNIEIIDWKIETSTKGTFKHFMLKEIFEQPNVIRNIANNYSDQIKKLATLVKNAQGTFFIAAGTAYNAALGGIYLFSKVAHRHVNAALASEFNYLLDFLTKKSLAIALSQSGETIDVIEPLSSAKKKGVTIAGIVNTLGSTLYRMSDFKLLLGAGPEKAVASTKAYTAKLSVLLMTSYELANKTEIIQHQMLEAANEIEKMTKKKFTDQIKHLAKILSKTSHIYTLGRGASYPTALEAALKIKEVSYIPTEGLAGGELKHGTIALIEKGTPVIVFAPNDETYEAMISNATEIKSRGGMIIGVSFRNSDVFDEYIRIKDLGDATLLTQIVPMQLLAYYLALELKLDPDKPRNLAKSVTVK